MLSFQVHPITRLWQTHIIKSISIRFSQSSSEKAWIQSQWEERLYSVLGNLINESGGKPIIINGVKDHVHCFFHAKPSVAISEIMKTTKAKSSKWINENNLLQHRFEWQSGYGCFSYGHSQKNKVYQYILNQKEHHKRMSFMEGYEKLLQLFDIDYDERFLFKKLK